jgi:predicted nucleic acid-binding Zn ribbon protein
VVQSFTDDSLTTCGECGGALRKVFGAVGISFKGSGFYKTDSRKGSSSSSAKDTGAKDGATKDGAAKDGGSKDGGSKAKEPAASGSSDKAAAPAAPPKPASTTP